MATTVTRDRFTNMKRVKVYDSNQDWIGVYVDEKLVWQGHPGDLEHTSIVSLVLNGTLGDDVSEHWAERRLSALESKALASKALRPSRFFPDNESEVPTP